MHFADVYVGIVEYEKASFQSGVAGLHMDFDKDN